MKALFACPTDRLCNHHSHPCGQHALTATFYMKITGNAVILTWYGNPNGNWDGLRALHKSPSASKVARPHSFICEHLQGIVVPAQTPQPSNMWLLFSKILYVFLVSSIYGEVYYQLTGTNYDRVQNKTDRVNITVFWDVTSCCLMKTGISSVQKPAVSTFTVTRVWNIMPPHTRTSRSWGHSSLWELQSSNTEHKTYFTWKYEVPQGDRLHYSNKSQGHAHWKVKSYVAIPWLVHLTNAQGTKKRPPHCFHKWFIWWIL